MNQVSRFLSGETDYEKDSVLYVLRLFLLKKKDTISVHTMSRIFHNLGPMGKDLGNPQLSKLKRSDIDRHLTTGWQKYSPETMRTKTADIRHFFKWCKKRKLTQKNLAKHLKPIRRRHGRKKAAPESSSHCLMNCLASKLESLLYRDVFKQLQFQENDRWEKPSNQKLLRDLFIIVFLYETGCRAGELANLGSRTMDTAVSQLSDTYQITVFGKTNDRDYAFTNKTAELWRLWRQFNPSSSAVDIKANGISQMLVRKCRQFNIRPFRSHSLRHAKIKRSRQLVGLETARRLVDHSIIETTRGYDIIDDEEIKTAVIQTGLQTDLFGSKRPKQPQR